MSKASKLNFTSDADRVEEMEFDPIQGYPMLHWRGKRPYRSTRYYPAQLKETYGQAVNTQDGKSWMNRIYWGDNREVMSHLLREFRGKVDLVYIDPPFDSKAEYKKTISLRGKSAASDHSAFEEKQYSDIWTNDEYLQFMYERLMLLRELLSETGSVFVHIDTKRAHYIHVIMDEIFGRENFQNAICWKRSPFAGSSKARAHKFPINHDVILFFTKAKEFYFSHNYADYSEKYLKRFKNPDNDPKGAYRITSLKSYSKERFEQWKKEGRLIPPKSTGAGWSYKQYLSESKGTQSDDFWNDIDEEINHSMWDDINLDNPMSNARVNYPTQKPEALVERIVKTCSKEGSLILDCFMGSGTTQAIAMKLGRRFIGADINLGAIHTTVKRLNGIIEENLSNRKLIDDDSVKYNGFQVYHVNNYEIFKNPIEAKSLLIEALELEPYQQGHLYDGQKDGRQFKIMPVNHIASKADLNDIVAGFDQRLFAERQKEMPNKPVEKITLVCMGHEPDLAAHLKSQVAYILDVEVVDILRDRQDIEFKRDSVAKVKVKKSELIVEKFYPQNLLQKLSLPEKEIEDWRQLVETIAIDWNYTGEVMNPAVFDSPGKNELVKGRYAIPGDAGRIHLKITDLISESLEMDVDNG